MKNNIKIKVYKPPFSSPLLGGSFREAFEINPKIINNARDLNFSEDLNAGAGSLDIELALDYNNKDFKVGDLIEYSIYNDNYKNGLLKYSGIIIHIQRFQHGVEQGITLQCESLVSLLADKDKNVKKTYSGTYKSIVNQILDDFGDNTCSCEFLGKNIFKNKVTNTENTSVEADGTLFSVLQKLFEKKKFFINAFGEIKDNFEKKHIIKNGKEIASFETVENKNGISEVDIEVTGKLDISCGDLIKIINTDSFLNLDGKQITKLDFSLEKQRLLIGNFGNIKVN